jgi:hypothetical protein
MLSNVEILRVVEILIHPILNRVDNTGLQIDQKSARYVVLIISLIEKHIFPVVSLGRVLLQVTFWIDTVLLTQTLPEFVSNYNKSDR